MGGLKDRLKELLLGKFHEINYIISDLAPTAKTVPSIQFGFDLPLNTECPEI